MQKVTYFPFCRLSAKKKSKKLLGKEGIILQKKSFPVFISRKKILKQLGMGRGKRIEIGRLVKRRKRGGRGCFRPLSSLSSTDAAADSEKGAVKNGALEFSLSETHHHYNTIL